MIDSRFSLLISILCLALFACVADNFRQSSDEFLADFKAGSLAPDEVEGSINAYDENGFTPIYIALKEGRGSAELVAELLNLGANPFLMQGDNNYPVRLLLQKGWQREFAISVCGDFDINEKLFEPIEGNDVYNRYPSIIHDAAIRGSKENIDALADCGARWNFENEYGATPLVAAAGAGNLATFGAIINAGGNLQQSPSAWRMLCSIIDNKQASVEVALREALGATASKCGN
tara:strand:- start:1463 stop:2161 length:699 start_codon:yes stop_codon:yes gene_type:complete